MLDRLSADPAFGVSIADMESALDPTRFVGRAPEQVDEFLDWVVAPLLAGHTRPTARRGGARMTIAQLEPLPLRHLRRGKVREVYVVDDDRLLLVATDRVSAFDVVMAEPIPYKGAVLTQITAWWLRQLEGDVRHHMISARRRRDRRRRSGARRPSRRARRSRHAVPPHRGLSRSSAWFAAISPARRGRSTAQSGTLAGESLAPGLRESERFDPPLFSPATKAETGHDENITVGARGGDRRRRRRRASSSGSSRLVYERGRDDRRRARNHHRGYEVRVRSRPRRARSR